MVRIYRIRCGTGNCFLIQENDNVVLVDTATTRYRDKVLKICKHKNIKLILLTHGHTDNVQNAAYLSKKLNAPIAMHRDDFNSLAKNQMEPMLAHGIFGKLLLRYSKKKNNREMIKPFYPATFIRSGDSLYGFGISAIIVGLPGHTKGSIGVLVEDSDFIVGDALMNFAYPTKALIYGDRQTMDESAFDIRESGARVIHYGHGKSTANRGW